MKKLILASGANSKTSCKFENFKTSKTNCSHSYLNTIEITHCSKLVLTGNQFQSLRELENCISRIIRVWSLFCSIRFKEVCIIFYRFFWETSFLSFCAFCFLSNLIRCITFFLFNLWWSGSPILIRPSCESLSGMLSVYGELRRMCCMLLELETLLVAAPSDTKNKTGNSF